MALPLTIVQPPIIMNLFDMSAYTGMVREAMTDSQLDELVPGYLISKADHARLAGKLNSNRIPKSMTEPDEIIAAIREIYIEEDLIDLWLVTRTWFRQNGFPNTPD